MQELSNWTFYLDCTGVVMVAATHRPVAAAWRQIVAAAAAATLTATRDPHGCDVPQHWHWEHWPAAAGRIVRRNGNRTMGLPATAVCEV